jgi:Flp pilus assembly protein TadG
VRHPRSRERSNRGRRRGDDRGAALVEFAFVALPLFLILFGTIEFGFAFFQLNDIRHGAREGMRLVAVNADPSPSEGSPVTQGEKLAQAACERMDRHDDVTITITLADIDGNGKLEVGDDATLQASKPLEQITNVFNNILDGVVIDETITTRLEQDPDVTLDGTTWTCA